MVWTLCKPPTVVVVGKPKELAAVQGQTVDGQTIVRSQNGPVCEIPPTTNQQPPTSRLLVRQRYLEHNPASELQLPREEKRLPRHALSVTEIEAVLALPDIHGPIGLRDRVIMEVFYSTGLRRWELARLELTDVDHQRGTVLVRCGKGRKDRVVPIGQRALRWLDKYLAEARPQLLQDPTVPAVFVTCHGRPIHVNHLSLLVRNYLVRGGITKRGSCHLFRHTTATLMLEAGADIRFIQALLGHTCLTTTQIYTHVSITKLCQIHRQTHPAGKPEEREGRKEKGDES